MASLLLNEQLPTTSEAALREFNEKYLQIISATPPSTWADRMVMPVGAPRTTFPISIYTNKFKETNQVEGTFVGMEEKSFDLTVKEFDSGSEAKLLDLFTNVFAYRSFQKAPSEIQIAETRHVAEQLITLLEAGNGTTLGTNPWDGLALFSASHKSNPSVTLASGDTWSNYQSVAADCSDLTKIQTEMTAMRSVRDTNGKKLGVEPDEIWLPTEKYQAVSDKLNQAFLASGESNYMAGKLRAVHVPELTDVNDWYLVDSKMMARGFDALIAAKYTPAPELAIRMFDESSDFFKKTGKIRYGVHIWYGFAYALPHAIRRIVGA